MRKGFMKGRKMNTSSLSKVVLFVGALAALLFAGCRADVRTINERDSRVAVCRNQTRSALVTNLRPDISTDEFMKQISVCPESYKVGLSIPYKSETRLLELDQDDPEILLVQWYYTDLDRNDGRVTKNELTPVISVDGNIIGWGNEFLEQVHQYAERKQAEARK
jgi:hypothetical protein